MKPRTRLATTLPEAWKLSKPMARRSIVGKPISRGIPPNIEPEVDVNAGAEGSPGLTGDSLDDPECTSTAANAVTSIWNENEAASTQRLRSPKVRWKYEIRAAPSRKERMAVRDLSQAREGVSTGRELTPRARKIVFPVCSSVG